MVSQTSPHLHLGVFIPLSSRGFSPHQCFFSEGGRGSDGWDWLFACFGFWFCSFILWLLIFKMNISSSVGSVLDTLLDFKWHHFFPPLNCQFQNTVWCVWSFATLFFCRRWLSLFRDDGTWEGVLRARCSGSCLSLGPKKAILRRQTWGIENSCFIYQKLKASLMIKQISPPFCTNNA